LLPCYWIYWEVGKSLLAKRSPDPLYGRWIETYAGEGFAGVVQAVLDLADRLGPQLSEAERRGAALHFATSSRYEWMFWDMAHRREQWPVG
jgi:thiaminase/transcriptional activator TenA